MCKMRQDVLDSLDLKRLNIQFNISFHTEVVAYCSDKKVSVSDYVNRLIREDFIKRGILTEEDLLMQYFLNDIKDYLKTLEQTETLHLCNKILKLSDESDLTEILQEFVIKIYPDTSKVKLNVLVKHCNCTLGVKGLKDVAESVMNEIDLKPILGILDRLVNRQ